MKLRKMGDINHDLEDLVEILISKYNMNWSLILKTFYKYLSKYPQNREIYIDDKSSPQFKISKIRLKPLHKREESLILKINKEYCKHHDLQWGEVLTQVFQYLQTHRPDAKDKEFYFYYGP